MKLLIFIPYQPKIVIYYWENMQKNEKGIKKIELKQKQKKLFQLPE